MIMRKGCAELFLYENSGVEKGKEIACSDAFNIIKQIDRQTDWDILKMIRNIISKKADSYSVSRDKPHIFLFVGNGSDEISITFENVEKKLEIKLPKRECLKL